MNYLDFKSKERTYWMQEFQNWGRGRYRVVWGLFKCPFTHTLSIC